MYKVNKMDRLTINLSQEHDNNATGIQFDYSDWIAKYGEGSIVLTHRRRGDSQPYVVNLEANDGVATWHVSDVDTAVKGGGACQLMYQTYDGKVLAQSALARTVVLGSNYKVTSTPEAYDNWLAELTELAGTTTHNVELSESAANRSEASANRSDTVKGEVESLKTTIESDIAEAKTYFDGKKAVIDKAVADASNSAAESEISAEASAKSATDAQQSAQASITAKNEAEAMKNTTATLKADTEAIKQQTAQLKSDTNAIKTETAQLKADTQSLKNNTQSLVNGFDSRVATAKDEIDAKKAEGVKAVQDTIATIPEDYTELVGEVSNVKKDLQSVESALDTRALKTDLDIANREIEALKAVTQGKDWIWQESEDVAYSKDVPKGAVRMGINKIGGKSLVLNQILHPNNSYKNKTADGITIERLENNKFHITGRKTTSGSTNLSFSYQPVEVVANCKYLHIVNSTDQDVRININEYSDTSWKADRITATAMVFTTTSETKTFSYTLRVYTDAKVDCTLEVMTFKLSGTGLDDITSYDEFKAIFPNHYYPFGATIISSQTDALEVRGGNLLDHKLFSKHYKGYINTYDDGSVDLLTGYGELYSKGIEVDFPIGTHILAFPIPKSNMATNGRLRFIYDDGNVYEMYITNASGLNSSPNEFVTEKRIKAIRFNWSITNAGFKFRLMVSKYDASNFALFNERTIPTNLPVLRSAGEAYDYIETDVTFPNMKSVDLGGLTWIKTSLDNVFYANMPSYKFESNVIGIVEGYGYVGTGTNATNTVGSADKTIALYYANGQSYREVYIHDSECTNASEMKAKLNGVILHYEATEGGEDYTTNVKHQSISERTLNGNEYWDIYRASGIDQVYVGDMNGIIKTSKDDRVNTLCAKFKSISIDNRELNYDTTYSGSIGICFNIKDITIEEWVAKLRSEPLTYYYELANERITEVELPPQLEAIRVESGGAVTFRNADDNYHIPIPNKETFMVKVEEAI